MESPASARAMLRAATRRTGRPSGARRVCAPRLLGARRRRRRTAGPRANTTRAPGAPVIGVLARSFVQSRRSARTGAESREIGRAGTLAPADTDVDADNQQNAFTIFRIICIYIFQNRHGGSRGPARARCV